MTITEQAKEEGGILFYTLPEQLTKEQLDPLIRDIVFRVNESGWVWTAESCQGHPDCDEENAPWGHNVDPFLRLVCRSEDLGRMMTLLVQSLRFKDNYGMPAAHGMRCYPRTDRSEFSKATKVNEWEEILVYLQGTNVATRNRSLQCFAKFAELLIKNRPVVVSRELTDEERQNFPKRIFTV